MPHVAHRVGMSGWYMKVAGGPHHSQVMADDEQEAYITSKWFSEIMAKAGGHRYGCLRPAGKMLPNPGRSLDTEYR